MAYEQCEEYADAYGMPEAINMGECPSADGTFDYNSLIGLFGSALGGGSTSTDDGSLSLKDMLTFDAQKSEAESKMQTTYIISGIILLVVVLLIFVWIATRD